MTFAESVFSVGGLASACLLTYMSVGLFFTFFIPSGAVLFSAGVLVSTGSISNSIIAVMTMLTLSSIAGSWTGYALGVRMGKALYTRGDSWYFKRSHLHKAEKLYSRYGEWATSISFFLPIARSFSPVVAGVGRLSPARFSLGSVAGSFCWVIAFVGAGYLLGIYPQLKPYLPYIVVVFISLVTFPVLLKLVRVFRST